MAVRVSVDCDDTVKEITCVDSAVLRHGALLPGFERLSKRLLLLLLFGESRLGIAHYVRFDLTPRSLITGRTSHSALSTIA